MYRPMTRRKHISIWELQTYILLILLNVLNLGLSEDVTSETFSYGSNEDIYPVAFGDYDSNKFTDMVVLTNDSKAFDIYLGLNFPPYLVKSPKIQTCHIHFQPNQKPLPVIITGIVLADFTGDSISDILVSFEIEGSSILTYQDQTIVQIYKGDPNGEFQCKTKLQLNGTRDYLQLKDEPLVVDMNGDTVADLYTETITGQKTFWLFNRNGGDGNPTTFEYKFNCENCNPAIFDKLQSTYPSSNSFIDLNGDFNPELVLILQEKSLVTTDLDYFIMTLNIDNVDHYNHVVNLHLLTNVSLPKPIWKLGNPVGLDMSLSGELGLLIPYCSDIKCKRSEFLLYQQKTGVQKLGIKLTDEHGRTFGFASLQTNPIYGETFNFYVGDYNLDGYPDLIGSLIEQQISASQGQSRVILFKNVPDHDNQNFGGSSRRTFEPDFTFLQHYSQTKAAFFFDLKEDGLLDIMMVGKGYIDPNSAENIKTIKKKPDIISTFQNIPEYDAYFIKWIVTTSTCSSPNAICPLYHGIRAPGASMYYSTTDLEIKLQKSAATQNIRSHFALDFPYTVMGTGKSANFIENVKFGITSSITKQKTQIIPNSILIAIPPASDQSGSKWEVKQLINPSFNGAANTFYVLLLICLGIGSGVFVLYLREKREDKLFIEQQKSKPMSLASITFA